METMWNNQVKALTDKQIITGIIYPGRKESETTKKVTKGILEVISKRQDKTTVPDLTALPGVDEDTAVRLLSCFELSRRYCPRQEPPARITNPDDIVKVLEEYRHALQEHFICITINGAGEILGKRVITIGLLNHALVHPREVFADAITDRAASIIVAHNHPSGSLEPSSQDLAITMQLKEAGKILGISLIDHIIISKNGHTSLRERGHV